MARKILINGRREEELRVAIVENQTLEDFEIETKRSGLLRNNIYRGVVVNIAPSLNAAFVDFGESRNGFLAFNDVVESAYAKPVKDAHKISDILVPGQTLIVQVIKDAGGLKGAQVTTNISLAGRYLVLRPKDAKSGVSRKVDDDARADLTQKVRSLDLPDGYGCIVRTNAMDQSRAVLLRDAKVLVQLWRKIESEFAKGTAPQLLYNDQDIVVQAMRDYFDSSIHEVLIDDKSCYERAKAYIRATVESGENKIKYYDDKMPIFTRYGIERQIEQIYARTVALPSGGFIVIDPTEALTAIDVNSAHSTKRESQDLTAYHTNLEAAVEIGRQLRMRDIGGLIVIDFIDMRSGKHQRDVERVMRNAMSRDKARNKVERISPNGLLEINRQRISQALSQRTHLQCPTCNGRGFIPSAEAMGLNLIREIDARAVNGELGGVIIKLHPDIAQQLQNERRREFAQLEHDYGIRIEIVATREISRGEDAIEWLTKRQENALHPERNSQNTDAASIIDVAEAYEAHDSDDDVYRPNDYEEFSSEEARKKRAAKRAARKENKEVKAEADVVEAKREEPVSKREKREKREAEKREKREDSAKADKTSAKESNKPEKMHAIARAASTMALLGILLEQMRHRMEDDQPRQERSRRHFSFKARSRKGETKSKKDSGIQTDLRMFSLDILKAVCVIACHSESSISRREMMSLVPAASDWLVESIQVPKDELLKRVAQLRTQITSRHATARLTCLFDENHGMTPDELGRALIADRDTAVGRRNVQEEGVLEELESCIASRCAKVFGDGIAPASFDTSAIDASNDSLEEDDIQSVLASAVAEETAPIMEVSSHDDVESSAEEEEEEREVSGRRNRRRRNRRRSMEETPISPYVGENCEIITSDVMIAPMTLIEGEDINEAEEDSALSIAQAITQELPAVGSDRRQRRQRHRDRQNAEASHEVKAASENDENVQTPVQTVEPVQTVDSVDASVSESRQEEKTAGSRRRERRATRRAFGDDEIVTESLETTQHAEASSESLEVKPAETEPARPEVHAENRSERSERRAAKRERRAEREPRALETQSAEVSEVRPAPAAEGADNSENRSIRRVRKTRAFKINLADYAVEALAETPAAPEAAVQIAEAAEIVAEANVVEANVVEAKPEVKDMESVQLKVSEPEMTVHEDKRERRTRRTRRGAFGTDEVSADAVEANGDVVKTVESAKVESTKVESAKVESENIESVSHTDRRERRTRRSARRQFMADDDHAVVVENVVVEPVAAVIEPVVEEVPMVLEVPAEPVSEVVSEKRRVRKTRRSSVPTQDESLTVDVVEEPKDAENVQNSVSDTKDKGSQRKSRASQKAESTDQTVETHAESAAPVEKRRVRKTRPRQAVEAAALVEAVVAQVEAESIVSEEPEKVSTEKRRVRKTRKIVEESAAVSSEAQPDDVAVSDETAPRSRVRRTRRTKLEE